jgi:prepilin peptidase CpaA
VIDWIAVIVVCVAVAVATFTDVRTLKVHNWLTLPLAVTGLAYHAALGGWAGFGESLLNLAMVFAILMVPYVLGAMGAGDVKLVSALAAWLGTSTAFTIGAIALFATAIYSLAMLFRQGRLKDAWLHFKLTVLRIQMVARHFGSDGESVHEMAATPEGRARLVPFSAMVALGTITTLIWYVWQASS